MADGVHISTANLLQASELAAALVLKAAPNGIRYASFGDTKLADAELDRIVQAVPTIVAHALAARAFYFVPLALPEVPSEGQSHSDRTLVSPVYTSELSDEAI